MNECLFTYDKVHNLFLGKIKNFLSPAVTIVRPIIRIWAIIIIIRMNHIFYGIKLSAQSLSKFWNFNGSVKKFVRLFEVKKVSRVRTIFFIECKIEILFKNCPEKAHLLRYNVFFPFQTQRQTRDVNLTFDHLEES